MVQKLLNELTIQALAEGEYWDTKLPAFGIRVGKTSRTFLLKKGSKRVKLGRYPAISLKMARSRALSLKGDNTHATPQISLGDAVDLFLTTHGKGYRPGTRSLVERQFRKLDDLRSKKLAAITTYDLTAIMDGLENSAANHFFAYTRTLFRFCIRRRLIPQSPLYGLSLPNKVHSRSRILTDAELQSIYQTVTRETSAFNTIVALLILTGQRRGEVAALQTSWVQNETITLPKEITKNGREHTFPIGKLATSLLNSSPKTPTTNFFFPARGKTNSSFNAWSRNKLQLDKLSGVNNWTLHDLRRTFSTRLAEMGVAPHIIERLLRASFVRVESGGFPTACQ